MKIFVLHSDSEKDKFYVGELRKQIRTLKMAKLINDFWFNDLIPPGDDKNQIIGQKLLEANLILVFISSDLFSIKNYDTFKSSIVSQRESGIKVIPILCRNCSLEYTPFEGYKSLPKSKEFISDFSTIDIPMTEIADSIKEFAKEYKSIQEEEEVTDFRPYEISFSIKVKTYENTEKLIVTESASCADIFHELYFLISDYVNPYSYLKEWILIEKSKNIRFLFKEIQDFIPASILFKEDFIFEIQSIDSPIINS